MTVVIDLAERRRARTTAPRLVPPVSSLPAEARLAMLGERYLDEGIKLAHAAYPSIAMYRTEPRLMQHIRGAFLRWQMDEIKAEHKDDPEAIGLALAAGVKAFTDTLIVLETGIDPDGGHAA